MYSFALLLDLIDAHPYLFALDPLLMQCFAQAASLEQYERLSTKIPLFLLLAAFIEESPRYNDRHVSVHMHANILLIVY